MGSILVTPLPSQDSSDMTSALHGLYPRKSVRKGIPKAAGCRAEDTCGIGFPDLRVYVTAKDAGCLLHTNSKASQLKREAKCLATA